jgi:hypothetical protein
MSGFDDNPFGGLGGLAGLLGNFQQIVADFQRKAAETEVSGSAGGVVTVTMTCDQVVQRVQIAEGAMEDRELLEDLVRAATNEALRKVREHMAQQAKSLTGGLPIPPGLIPGL